ncbi:MAG: hypothetical protein K9G76_10490 [Bacteroidales bacterium]|nr:hypothetical protein [Bacteroidales bacterium]
MKTTRTQILLFAFALMLFAGCKKVYVVVDEVPGNTPSGDPLYITGNFNNWDPGDERFRLTFNDDSTWSINLPPGFGTIEYKFTRGDWTTVEKDLCGNETDNRMIYIDDTDTAYNQIASWNDLDPLNCPRMTILVTGLPENTPEDEAISIMGNFNSWNTDTLSRIKRKGKNLYVTIDRPSGADMLEFKLSRGSLSSAEADEFGNDVPNRVVPFGQKDTVQVKVEGWVDMPKQKGNDKVVFIIIGLPENTPPKDDLYIASNFNSWKPGDRNYTFTKNTNGDLVYLFPRKKERLEFKVTRGSWYNAEVDRFGYDTPNRQVNLKDADTVKIKIFAWKDIPAYSNNNLTIVLESLPATTPENPEIYLAGNLNNWDPNRRKYQFSRAEKGYYFLDIDRRNRQLECKVTRGAWENMEVDAYGSDIPNRRLNFMESDTAFIKVANWKDLPVKETPYITIVINKMPLNTPVNDKIYLVPDFNDWDPTDENLVFQKMDKGKYFITIPRHGNATEYKITRGGWGRVETDENGNPIPNRVLNYGFSDTLYIELEKWRDLGGNY